MKLEVIALCLLAVLLITGCTRDNHEFGPKQSVLAEGVIWYVEYELGKDKSTGFSEKLPIHCSQLSWLNCETRLLTSTPCLGSKIVILNNSFP